MSDLELSMILIGSIVILIWGYRAICRKMMATEIRKIFSCLAGILTGCVLAFCWSILVAIAFDPKSLSFMFPVAMMAIWVFYAAWRYTRIIKPGVNEPSAPNSKLVQLVVDEYTLIKDHLRDSKAKEAVPSGMAFDNGRESAALLPALYEFDYAKEDGEISSRRVFVQSTSVSGDRRYLEGICKTRNAKRTFRVDRVIGPMIRVDDGDVIRAPELFDMSFPRDMSAAPVPSSSRASQRKREWETAVFFAGFGSVKRAELEALAEAAGWQVRSTITKTVDYVVTGSMAGSAQLAKAGEMGITVLDEAGFRGVV